MLVDVPLAKAIWHEGATPDGSSSDVQKHITRTQLRAAHLVVSFLGDVSHIVEPQSLKMHVLASEQRDARVEVGRRPTCRRYTAANLAGVVLDPVNRPHRLSRQSSRCLVRFHAFAK